MIEAFEVTANAWTSKLAGAAQTIRDNDLSRLSIIAAGVTASGDDLHRQIVATNLDLSVLELQPFCMGLIAALTKHGRESALIRLYELLDRYQPRVELVNQYVQDLIDAGLAERP